MSNLFPGSAADSTRTYRRSGPRFSGAPGPLRRYERLGRCGGLGPRGTLRIEVSLVGNDHQPPGTSETLRVDVPADGAPRH